MTRRTAHCSLGLPALAVLAAALPSACAGITPDNGDEVLHSAAPAESAPPMGSAASFAVLAGTTVTSTGATTIDGNLGVYPGLAITGFPPAIVSDGTIHGGDAIALQAQTDVTSAYDVLAGEACTADLTGTDLGGLTLVPGVYCFSSSAQLTGTLVLDAQGDAGAVFVFQMVSTLTTASNASVSMINGGDPCDVFWQVGSSAVLGTGTTFSGSMFALTSISLGTGAQVSGRALARNGAVTMDDNAVGGCAAAPTADAGVDAAPVDSGNDASGSDAAPIDSGNDAPGIDAAPIDSGHATPEAGVVDAAPIDSGNATPEAGAVDACVEDAGPAEVDAGAPGEDAAACCDDGGTLCGGACTDLGTDSNNCGACGNACAATETCSAGSCCSGSGQ